MLEKYLIIILSGLDQKGKMIVGLNFAKNVSRKKLADDVKVVFFGPSEEALAEHDPDVDNLMHMLTDLNVIQIACNGYAAAKNVTEDIAKIGIRLEDVSDTITRYAEQGYKIITF
ncbi:DsrE family protein [Oxyplasma meridianum]|uniref:DsrE family protein n=1 Tax=Oxyplasma meridianum TaxID=3073602 RepID=A0AAX4NEE2_9ARCH